MKALFGLAAILLVLPLAAAAQSMGKIPIEVMSCTELQCIYRTDVFLTGQYAYLDYNSSVKGVTVSGILTFPDESIQQITFPNRIMPNISGTYLLQITAWKDGYDETVSTKFIQFVDNPLLDNSSVGNRTVDQNPPKVDVIPIIAVIILAAGILAAWRYTKRTPRHKKESKRI